MENKNIIEAGKSINEIEEFLNLNKDKILTLVSKEELDDEYRYVFKFNGKLRYSPELPDCLLIGFESMITINPDGTIDVYDKSSQYNEMGFIIDDYIIKSSPTEIKAFNKCMKIRKYNSK